MDKTAEHISKKPPVDLPPKKEAVDIPHKKRRAEDDGMDIPWAWIGLAVVVLLVITFLIIPAWKGYRMYQAAKDAGVEDYVFTLSELRDAKEAAEASEQTALERLSAYTGEVETARTTVASAQSEREAAQAALKEKSELCETLLNSYSEDLNTAHDELDSCEEERDDIVGDAANRLCCIQRTFDVNITGYEIDGSTISCVHSGGDPITC